MTELDLAKLVVQRLGECDLRRSRGVRGCVVQARDGDGISSAAAAIVERLKREKSGLPCVEVAERGTLNVRPAVLDVMSTRAFVLAARKSGFSDSSSESRTAFRVLLVLGITVVGLAAVITAIVLHEGRGDNPTILDLGGIVGALVSVASPLLAKWLETRIAVPSSYRQQTDAIVRNLNDVDLRADHSDEYVDLIGRLTIAMGVVRRPRVVVVDCYDRIDELSRAVFDKYLRGSVKQRNQKTWEFWVIFERQSSQSLWQRIMRDEGDDGLRHLHLWRMVELSFAQRSQLAEAIHRPERARHVVVKDILGPDDRVAARVRNDLNTFRHSHPQHAGETSALDMLNLLATTAELQGSPVFSRMSLRRVLSTEKPKRSALLAGILPGGRPAATKVEDLVTDMLRCFPSCVRIESQDGGVSFRVHEEVAKCIRAEAHYLHLAEPGLVHAFWALLWSDQFGDSPHPYIVLKASAHVLEATPEDGDTASVRLLFDVAFRCTHECLLQPLVDDVPKLLDRANHFATTKTQEAQVAKACWEAYALTADSAALELLLELQPDLTGRHGKHVERNATEQAMYRVYATSLADVLDRPVLAALMRADDFFVDFGIVQVAWQYATLLTLYPQATLTWIDDSPALMSTMRALSARVLERLDPILSAKSSAMRSRKSLKQAEVTLLLDIYTLSVLVCITSLAELAAPPGRQDATTDARRDGERSVFVDVLSTVALVADALQVANTATFSGAELVVQSVAQDLVMLCRAGTAAIVNARGRDDALSLEACDVLSVFGDSGRSESPTEATISRRLYGLHLAWRSLGFSAMADSLALRSAQLSAACSGAFSDWSGPVAAAQNDGGAKAFFGWAIAAQCEVTSDENRAIRTQNAVVQLSTTRVGSDRARLCMLDLDVTGQFSVDRSDMLDVLLDVDADEIPLAQLLSELDDSALRSVYIDLLNAINREPAGPRVDRLTRALRTRRERIVDSKLNSNLEGAMHAHDLVRRLELATPDGREIDANAEYALWPGPRTDGSYVYFLTTLLQYSGCKDNLILAEAQRTISAHGARGGNQQSLGIVLLTFMTNEHHAKNSRLIAQIANDFILALKYDRRGIRIDDGLQMCDLLRRNDRDSIWLDAVRQELFAERIRRDEEEIVRPYYASGRYFEIFAHYARTMRALGASCAESGDVPTLITDAEKRGYGFEWARKQVHAPDPTLMTQKGRALNWTFVEVGECVMAAYRSHERSPECDEAQREFERASYNNLNRLLGIGLEIADLSAPLTALLERQRERFAEQPIAA